MVKFHLYSLHVDGVDRVGGDHSFVLLEGEHQVEEVEGPRVAPLGGQRGGVETLRLRGVHLATQSVTYQPPDHCGTLLTSCRSCGATHRLLRIVACRAPPPAP